MACSEALPFLTGKLVVQPIISIQLLRLKGCIPNFRIIAPDIISGLQMDKVSGFNQRFSVRLKPDGFLADYPRHTCRGNYYQRKFDMHPIKNAPVEMLLYLYISSIHCYFLPLFTPNKYTETDVR